MNTPTNPTDPTPADPTPTPTPAAPSTGDVIGADINAVNAILGPILSEVAPGIGTGVTLGLKILSVLEPAAYNAVAALIQGQDLTPEQQAEIDRVTAALEDPDSYIRS